MVYIIKDYRYTFGIYSRLRVTTRQLTGCVQANDLKILLLLLRFQMLQRYVCIWFVTRILFVTIWSLISLPDVRNGQIHFSKIEKKWSSRFTFWRRREKYGTTADFINQQADGPFLDATWKCRVPGCVKVPGEHPAPIVQPGNYLILCISLVYIYIYIHYQTNY